MPLLIGIRDDPRGWRGNVSAESKMPAGRNGKRGRRGREGEGGAPVPSKCIRCQERGGAASDRLKRRNESREDEGGGAEGYKRAREDVVWHVSL